MTFASRAALALAFVCLLASVDGACAKTAGVIRAPAGPLTGGDRFTPNQNGETPSDLVAIAPGLLAVIDHVSGIVLFTDGEGNERGRGQLPAGFRVDIVRNYPDRTVLIGLGGREKIVFPRSDTPAALPAVTAVPVTPDDAASPRFIARGSRLAGLVPQSGSGFPAELEIRGIGPGTLAAATFIGVDREGRAYSLAREINVLPVAERDGAMRSRIEVTMIVGRHDAAGVRREIASIPVERMYKYPRGRYVAIEPDGSVAALLPLKGEDGKAIGVVIDRPKFVPEDAQVARSPLGAEAIFLSLKASESGAAAHTLANDAPGSPVVEDHDAPHDAPPGGPPSQRTIAEMQRAAAEIMSMTWTVSNDNLAVGRQLECDFAQHDESKAFELPHQLKGISAGTVVAGVPYNWGGKGDLAQIRRELEEGFLAGNICSQIDHAVPHTTGLDCSGFVAQVWGVNGFGTVQTHLYSVPLASLEDLRWGDAFNRIGKHIRLFVSVDATPDEGTRFNTIESASACGGTCAVSYHMENFNGYEIRRFSPS